MEPERVSKIPTTFVHVTCNKRDDSSQKKRPTNHQNRPTNKMPSFICPRLVRKEMTYYTTRRLNTKRDDTSQKYDSLQKETTHYQRRRLIPQRDDSSQKETMYYKKRRLIVKETHTNRDLQKKRLKITKKRLPDTKRPTLDRKKSSNSASFLAAYCNRLQHDATHCNTLQQTAMHSLTDDENSQEKET